MGRLESVAASFAIIVTVWGCGARTGLRDDESAAADDGGATDLGDAVASPDVSTLAPYALIGKFTAAPQCASVCWLLVVSDSPIDCPPWSGVDVPPSGSLAWMVLWSPLPSIPASVFSYAWTSESAAGICSAATGTCDGRVSTIAIELEAATDVSVRGSYVLRYGNDVVSASGFDAKICPQAVMP